MLIAFNKPYGVLSQFSPTQTKHRTLAEFGFPKNVYPIGRLDADSEGMLLLSDEPDLNDLLLNPRRNHRRIYLAQIENIPSGESLRKLRDGVIINNRRTLPCHVRIPQPQPDIEQRNPPIRFRKNIPVCWIEIELIEGKNRQVRKMTASIGHPTLRLMRVQIGDFCLDALDTGTWKILSDEERKKVFLASGMR